jgi:hypothetical protein
MLAALFRDQQFLPENMRLFGAHFFYTHQTHRTHCCVYWLSAICSFGQFFCSIQVASCGTFISFPKESLPHLLDGNYIKLAAATFPIAQVLRFYSNHELM